MTADADLYLAYEYGTAIGRPASECMKLPMVELYGYIAFLRKKKELIDRAT